MNRAGLTLLTIVIFVSQIAAQAPEAGSARAHFEEGMRLMRERSFEAALVSLERSAALDPRQAATWGSIGAAAFRLGQFGKAEAAIRTGITLRPADVLFRAELCRALSAQNKHSEAVLECTEAVRISPDSELANAGLFITARRAGRPLSELLTLADSLVSKFPDSEMILVSAADVYLIARNYSNGITLLEKLAAINPRQPIYFGRLAEAYLRTERDVDALAAARKALELDPRNPHAHYAMGLIFFELGQHEEASASFSNVPQGVEELIFADYYRSVSDARQGRNRAAIRTMEALTVRHPKIFEFQAELGNLFIDQARYEDAIGPLKKAIELKRGDLQTQSGLGLALLESAQFSEAIPVLQEALRISPGNPQVTMLLNVASERQKQAPRIDELKKEAASDPKSIDIRVKLVQILGYSRRLGEAEAYVAEIYSLKPSDTKIYLAIAVAYTTAGNLSKAEDAYKRSIQLDPDPGAYLGLANIYAKRIESEAALAAYAKVIELKPDSPNVMILYANYLRDLGKRREALNMYQRSLGIQSSNANAVFQAGILSAKLAEYDAAGQYLERLRPLDRALAKRLERFMRLNPIWSKKA